MSNNIEVNCGLNFALEYWNAQKALVKNAYFRSLNLESFKFITPYTVGQSCFGTTLKPQLWRSAKDATLSWVDEYDQRLAGQ